MNKLNILILLFIIILSCSSSVKRRQTQNELRIVKIDSITDYYVFNTIDFKGNHMIVLGDMEKVSMCRPFKRTIIKDSIHETSFIRHGTRYSDAGFYELTIDKVKVKEAGTLANTILSCDAFR